MARKAWSNSSFVRTALPMFGFVLVAWYGLSGLMASKLKIRGSVRGYESVEEYDPIERMKRLAAGPAVKSLEEELTDMQSRVNIKDFDYKPVPRTQDEE